MFYYLKKIATNIALLCVIVGSLSAASILDNPPPIKDFPECPVAASGADFLAKKREIEDWFKDVDATGVLFKTVFPGGLPQNKPTYNSQNPKTTYATWHNSKFAVSGASEAKLAEVEKKAERYKEQAQGAEKKAEKATKEAERAKEEVKAAQQQLTTTTGELQEQLVAQGAGGDLVARNPRLADVYSAALANKVELGELIEFSDVAKWVLQIPYQRNGKQNNIIVPFDSEHELDDAVAEATRKFNAGGHADRDILAEFISRSPDLANLLSDTTVVIDFMKAKSNQGLYAITLPFTREDGSDDCLLFPYENTHELREAFDKAQLFMRIGAAKAGGGRSVKYETILTPRPKAEAGEPQAVTSLMDSYYLFIEASSKNQDVKDKLNEMKARYDQAYPAIEILYKGPNPKLDAGGAAAFAAAAATGAYPKLEDINAQLDLLTDIAQEYGRGIEEIKKAVKTKHKILPRQPGVPKDITNQSALEYIEEAFTNFVETYHAVQEKSSHDLFRECILNLRQYMQSIKSTNIYQPGCFLKYENALDKDEQEVKKLILEEEQQLYAQYEGQFHTTQQEIADNMEAMGINWRIERTSEEALKTSGVVDDEKYKEIPSILHFLSVDPVFMLVALQKGGTILQFLTTRPVPTAKDNIFELFEKEIAYLSLTEKQAFFVYLKNILNNFDALEKSYNIIATRPNRIKKTQIEKLILSVKKYFKYPPYLNYRNNETKPLKDFIGLLLDFIHGTLLYSTLEKELETALKISAIIGGKSAEYLTDIVECADIPGRKVQNDKDTLTSCVDYLTRWRTTEEVLGEKLGVKEDKPVSELIKDRKFTQVLKIITDLREAEKIVNSEAFAKEFRRPPTDIKVAIAQKKALVEAAKAAEAAATKANLFEQIAVIETELIKHDTSTDPFLAYKTRLDAIKQKLDDLPLNAKTPQIALAAQPLEKLKKDLNKDLGAHPLVFAAPQKAVAASTSISSESAAAATAAKTNVIEQIAQIENALTGRDTSSGAFLDFKTRLETVKRTIAALGANVTAQDISAKLQFFNTLKADFNKHLKTLREPQLVFAAPQKLVATGGSKTGKAEYFTRNAEILSNVSEVLQELPKPGVAAKLTSEEIDRINEIDTEIQERIALNRADDASYGSMKAAFLQKIREKLGMPEFAPAVSAASTDPTAAAAKAAVEETVALIDTELGKRDISITPFSDYKTRLDKVKRDLSTLSANATRAEISARTSSLNKLKADLNNHLKTLGERPLVFAAPPAPSIAAVSASASAFAAAGGGGVVKVATPIKTSGETPDQLKTRLLGEITAIKANLDTRDVSVEPFLSQNGEILAIETAIEKIVSPGAKDMAPLSMHGRKIQEIKTALGL